MGGRGSIDQSINMCDGDDFDSNMEGCAEGRSTELTEKMKDSDEKIILIKKKEEVSNHAYKHKPYKLYVKTLTGKTVVLDYYSVFYVDDIKFQLREKEGIPEDQQRLIFAGCQREDSRVNFWGPDVTFHLVLRLDRDQELLNKKEKQVKECIDSILGIRIHPSPVYVRKNFFYECQEEWNPRRKLMIEVDINRHSSIVRAQIYRIQKGKSYRNHLYRTLIFSESLHGEHHRTNVTIENETKTKKPKWKRFWIIPEEGSWDSETTYFCSLDNYRRSPFFRFSFRTGKFVQFDRDLEERTSYLLISHKNTDESGISSNLANEDEMGSYFFSINFGDRKKVLELPKLVLYL